MPTAEVFYPKFLNPREDLNSLIERKDTTQLLLKAGSIHGHYCPGLALGVLASVEGLFALARLKDTSLNRLLRAEGMEDLIVIVETNSCVSDGVQVVTSCTFGNNSMIYHDFGKTALTIGDRSGAGIRVSIHPNYRNVIDESVPEFTPLFEKVVKDHDRTPELLTRFKAVSAEAGFSLLNKATVFLTLKKSRMTIPDYASIRESKTCTYCGEPVIAHRALPISNSSCDEKRWVCIPCAQKSFHRLTGEGIILTTSMEAP